MAAKINSSFITEPRPTTEGRRRKTVKGSGVRSSHLVAATSRFFEGRGPHLAAMVAYFALASFVPLIFLALAGLGLSGQVSASSALVSYLHHIFPGQSVDQIVSVVHTVQSNARTLTIIGSIGLLWSSVSLFSSLESAFNIVYGRPNRVVSSRQGGSGHVHGSRAADPLRRC